MTHDDTQNSLETLPERLAAAAGAGELAAAAAIDAEEGDKFLHSLLADQMAAAHLVAMRMAAAADRAIGAAAGADPTEANLPLFDLAAARFAGAAARLNGRYCRGLQTLRALAGVAEEDVRWIGIIFESEHEPSPHEMERRINRQKFYKAREQAAAQQAAGRGRCRIDAAERATLAAAGAAARDLVVATGVAALAAPARTRHTTLFTHQLAALHRLMMQLSGRADAAVMTATDPLDCPAGLRLAHGSARLMERFRQGVAMLKRLRTGPDKPGSVEYFDADPLTDEERAQERAEDLAAGLDPDTGLPAFAPSGATAGKPADLVRRSPQGEARRSLLARRSLGEGGGEGRRGRLNNGNPGGDFLAAPRCGARTRAGCGCRQPAMANGRCRFHGGKSTGPRTEAGRARARANRLVHGLRSAELIALAAAASAAHRHLGALLAMAARRTNKSDRNDSKIRTLVSPRRKPGSTFQGPEFMDPGFRRGDMRELEQPKTETPAGHGVDRSESNAAARTATILPFPRPNPVQPRCRNPLPRVRS